MPIHNWSHVDACIFHDFHQAWTVEISHCLNGGGLPPEYFALIARPARSPRHTSRRLATLARTTSTVKTVDAASQARVAEACLYANRANRITIRDRQGAIVTVVQIVSPGDKSSAHALWDFVQEAKRALRQRINLLVVDLFPPSPRDPQGIHKAIWDKICEELSRCRRTSRSSSPPTRPAS